MNFKQKRRKDLVREVVGLTTKIRLANLDGYANILEIYIY